VRKAAELLAGSTAVLQINTDQCPELAARFSVRGIPVLHLLVNGASREQLPGARSAESIVEWFRRGRPGVG
jgi:thioredoxin 2